MKEQPTTGRTTTEQAESLLFLVTQGDKAKIREWERKAKTGKIIRIT